MTARERVTVAILDARMDARALNGLLPEEIRASPGADPASIVVAMSPTLSRADLSLLERAERILLLGTADDLALELSRPHACLPVDSPLELVAQLVRCLAREILLQRQLEASQGELASARAGIEAREQLLRQSMQETGRLVLDKLEESRIRHSLELTTTTIDPDTGAFRHGAFRDRLAFEVDRSARTGQPLGLLLVDLDDFGRYNRDFGYAEGDRLLAYVSRSVRTPWLHRPAVRPPVFGREGGDCLGILLPGADRNEVATRAEEVWDLLSRLPPKLRSLTVSVGAVSANAPPPPTHDLLERCRRTLEEAQTEGGNRFVVGDMEA